MTRKFNQILAAFLTLAIIATATVSFAGSKQSRSRSSSSSRYSNSRKTPSRNATRIRQSKPNQALRTSRTIQTPSRKKPVTRTAAKTTYKHQQIGTHNYLVDKRNVPHADNPIGVHERVQLALREAHQDNLEDLAYHAEKTRRSFNKINSVLRNEQKWVHKMLSKYAEQNNDDSNAKRLSIKTVAAEVPAKKAKKKDK
jgi:hypothetical protein